MLLALSTNATNEHCDVGTLATSVGVELIEYEETQVLVDRVTDRTFLHSRKQELEHHVIGQQNLGRAFPHLLPHVLLFLASVLAESDREGIAGGVFVVLFVGSELVRLGVDKSVHRIDDNRRHAARLRFGEKPVKNRTDIGKRLA